MKTFTTAEDAATPLRDAGYTYMTSTDAYGNVVEMYDPDARNHLFEGGEGQTRQVSYHEGVYYNIPGGTKVVTSLVESKLSPPGTAQSHPFHNTLTHYGYVHVKTKDLGKRLGKIHTYEHPFGYAAQTATGGMYGNTWWQGKGSPERLNSIESHGQDHGKRTLEKHLSKEHEEKD